MEINKTGLVKNYILGEIKEGRIKNGERLPSCREVASQLSINKITVNRAYHELEEEHRVYSIPRGGFYLINSVASIKVRPREVDFKNVKPDERLIPYREFTHVMNKAVEMYKNSLFEYETSGGLTSLRDTLRSEFEKDGVYIGSNNIIITHGAQQAISLVLQSIFKGKNVKLLVEVPTYNLLLKLAEYLGIEVVGIERYKDGFDFRNMEKILASGDVGAFYIIPRHHNPTGYNLAEKDKQRIADLANKYKVVIIEDDYLADLGSRKGSMPIHYYDKNKSTVYIRSFSKTFMPGIRMGAAVVPEPMYSDVLSFKQLSDLNTSKLPQEALNMFIKSGMYEKHIRKVRKLYEVKLRRANEIFKALYPEGLNYHVPEHGIFIWLELPGHIKGLEVEKKLREHGILVKGAEEFLPGDFKESRSKGKGYNFLRLCISGVSEEQLDTLADVISVIKMI